MKKVLIYTLVLMALPLFSSCKDNILAGTEWVSADGSSLLFDTNVGGYYSYVAYAGITGERTDCVSDFTYRFDGESEGEMHVRHVITGCIIDSYFWTFTVTGDELHLKCGEQYVVFVKR